MAAGLCGGCREASAASDGDYGNGTRNRTVMLSRGTWWPFLSLITLSFTFSLSPLTTLISIHIRPLLVVLHSKTQWLATLRFKSKSRPHQSEPHSGQSPRLSLGLVLDRFLPGLSLHPPSTPTTPSKLSQQLKVPSPAPGEFAAEPPLALVRLARRSASQQSLLLLRIPHIIHHQPKVAIGPQTIAAGSIQVLQTQHSRRPCASCE